jgi:signal transduction histidine kinase
MASSFRHKAETAAGALALLTLLGAAVGFALADQTSRVTSDLIEVQTLEGASTDAALYRANLAIAVAGVAARDQATVAAAMAATHEALDRLAPRTSLGADFAADLTLLRESARRVGDSLETDDPDAVADDALGTAGPALNRISSQLGAASGELSAAIAAEQAEAGRAARLSSFSAALIAPALVLLAYRRSARRRLDHQRLQAELQRTHDLSRAKDELIAGLSHQLRTPLTGIQGFASAVLEQAEHGQLEKSQVVEMTGAIYGESQELGRMIDDFLVASRSEAGSLSFVLVATQMTDAIRPVVEATVRAGRHLTLEIEDQLVLVDPSRVRQLLRNLIDNAYAYGRDPVALRGRSRGDRYQLQVADRGPGIPPADLAKAFAGFVHSGREATVTGSLGLGLYVAQTLARGLGSDLVYRREANETIFEIELPLVRSTPKDTDSYSLAVG